MEEKRAIPSMKIKNNFVSAVTIGSFNPAILARYFIEKECDFPVGGEPIEEQKTPVFSRIKYPRIEFIADLDRFQIVERGLGDPGDSNVTKYLQTYLEKLPYTPILICGINVNVDILGVNEKSLFEFLIVKANQLFRMMEINECTVETTLRYELGKKQYLKWDIVYPTQEEGVIGKMTIGAKQYAVWRVNYNYEVRGLDKNRARLEIITEGFPQIIERYRGMVKNIFKGA